MAQNQEEQEYHSVNPNITMAHASKSRDESTSLIPSGVPRMAPYILSGLGFLTAVYSTLFFTFRNSTSILGLPEPAPEYCQDVDGVCSRSDLFAFQVTAGLPIAFCGASGFMGWHLNRRPHTAVPATPAGRLFGYLPEAELLASVIFTFQVWDFFVSILIPEHRTAVMMSHHVMAATVSFCSIRYSVLNYYGIFYLGITEVSSVFLVFVDLAKFFPPIPGTLYDHFVGIVCGPMFVVAFTAYRVILWWPVSYRLFTDVYSVVTSGQAQKLRPGCSWVLYVFLGCNLPLGLLQLYWFTIILGEVAKVLGISW